VAGWTRLSDASAVFDAAIETQRRRRRQRTAAVCIALRRMLPCYHPAGVASMRGAASFTRTGPVGLAARLLGGGGGVAGLRAGSRFTGSGEAARAYRAAPGVRAQATDRSADGQASTPPPPLLSVAVRPIPADGM